MRENAAVRLTLTVVVTLLVALAGCGSLVGGSNGYGVDGADLDGQTLTSSTAVTVELAGSYTLESNATLSGSRQGSSFRSGYDASKQVDFDERRGLRYTEQTAVGTSQAQNSTQTVYTDGNRSFRRLEVGGETRYDTQSGQASGIAGIDPVAVDRYDENYTGLVDGLDWQLDGTTQFDGTTVSRYRVAGVDNATLIVGSPNATMEAANGTLLVDSDGAVRELQVGYTVRGSSGQSQTLALTVALRQIGSTTIPEPDWLSQAQSG